MKRYIGLFVLILCILTVTCGNVRAESSLEPTVVIKSMETIKPPTFNEGDIFEIIYVDGISLSYTERITGAVKGLVERDGNKYLVLIGLDEDGKIYVIDQENILFTTKVEKEEEKTQSQSECFIQTAWEE